MASPAIGSDGTVYFGSIDHKLYAINGQTGAKLWEFDTGYDYGSIPPPPLALMARFTSGHTTEDSMPSMARLGPSYGNLKREISGSSAAIGSDGTVYVGSHDENSMPQW